MLTCVAFPTRNPCGNRFIENDTSTSASKTKTMGQEDEFSAHQYCNYTVSDLDYLLPLDEMKIY